MTPVERRERGTRIEVHRPVEILDPETGFILSGYTKNLSERGMLARFEVPPPHGQKISLSVTLVDGSAPVAKVGKVVWHADAWNGDGSDVALAFVDPGAIGDEPAAEPTTPIMLLVPGREVQLTCGGNSAAAVIETAVPDVQAGPGVMLVVLRMGSARLVASAAQMAEKPEDDGEIDLDTVDCTAHPLRDLKDKVVRYGGPIVKFAARMIARGGRLTWRVAKPLLLRLWARMPERPRSLAIRVRDMASNGLGGVSSRIRVLRRLSLITK
ncbi:MAG: PilZ domain-containing protein [Deltaproteobacteria bacterium]|nr:PilZ domain-containing protein [Deltaproteobacteria bacterium]